MTRVVQVPPFILPETPRSSHFLFIVLISPNGSLTRPWLTSFILIEYSSKLRLTLLQRLQGKRVTCRNVTRYHEIYDLNEMVKNDESP